MENWILAIPIIGIFIVLSIVLISILALTFWIWMLVDCAKRNFKNETEKIVWILIIALTQFIGALVYFIVIRLYNKKGIMQ